MGNLTSNLTELNKRLQVYLYNYNTYRPHESLNQLTPAEYLKIKFNINYVSKMC